MITQQIEERGKGREKIGQNGMEIRKKQEKVK